MAGAERGRADEDAPDFTALGVLVGHATDEPGGTGCTVILGARGPMRGAATLVGRAGGTRELAVLEPSSLADRVDAVLLTGGSAYGLDAAAGVMRWCEERGRGFDVGAGVVPIVPAAVLFDLLPCGRFDARPTPAMAYEACERAAASGIAEGSIGAGTGATVGKALGVEWAMKGGVGCAVVRGGGATAGAVAVANAFGDVRDASGSIVAGARTAQGGYADALRVLADASAPVDGSLRNTTLAVVVVDVPLGRVALAQLARAASAGLHRRITPAGTTFDGDVVFALCPFVDAGAGGPPRVQRTPDVAARRHQAAADAIDSLPGAPPGAQDTPPTAAPRHPFTSDRIDALPVPRAAHPAPVDDPAALVRLEALAADALARAVERGVRRARGRDGVPGLADGGAPAR